MGKYLTVNQIDEFEKTGVLVVPGFYDVAEIESVRRGIYDIIGLIMVKYGVEDTRGDFESDSFDKGYLDLIKVNRAWGGEVYDAIKQIPAFIRLLASTKHEAVFSDLRRNALPGIASGGYGIRIDYPFEEKFRTFWHQEYPAQLRSLDGLVFWGPLVNITEELGPVIVCPGSQIEGALPVYEADPQGVGRNGAYALMIKDEDKALAKYRKISPLSAPGDLIILDFLVLHRSGTNSSSRARWSMQFRYFNFCEPTGISHGWKGSFASGVDFGTVHPELVCKE